MLADGRWRETVWTRGRVDMVVRSISSPSTIGLTEVVERCRTGVLLRGVVFMLGRLERTLGEEFMTVVDSQE